MVNSETLENIKLIEKMQNDINTNGIEVESLIADLTALRTLAIEQEQPRMAMALRLTYEHLEENDGFMIPIPEEVEVDEDGIEIGLSEQEDLEDNVELQKESLVYLLALMSDLSNKANYAELKEYNLAMKDY